MPDKSGSIAVVACPSCRTRVRVPTDRGRLKIHCRECGTTWFHPSAVEYSDIDFRCARDGAYFTVSLARSSPDQQFKIDRIFAHATAAPPERRIGSGRPGVSAPAQVGSVRPSNKRVFSAHDYDWGGFYCPCCGYIPAEAGDSFCHCEACGEFVCQSNVIEDKNTRPRQRIFHCYPQCGKSGVIAGAIREFESDHRLKADAPKFTSLPGGTRSTIPAPKSGPSDATKRLPGG
jgi:hypothetical protein